MLLYKPCYVIDGCMEGCVCVCLCVCAVGERRVVGGEGGCEHHAWTHLHGRVYAWRIRISMRDGSGAHFTRSSNFVVPTVTNIVLVELPDVFLGAMAVIFAASLSSSQYCLQARRATTSFPDTDGCMRQTDHQPAAALALAPLRFLQLCVFLGVCVCVWRDDVEHQKYADKGLKMSVYA